MTSLSTLPFSSLNFTADCVLAAQFEALRNETSATAAFTIDKEDVGDVPVLTLVALVRAGVPPSINLTGITDGNIVDWYLPQHRADPNVGSDAITAPEACRAEYCRALRWEGDPDLAGIGVFISYLLEAAILLILLPWLAYFYFRYDTVPGRRNRARFSFSSPSSNHASSPHSHSRSYSQPRFHASKHQNRQSVPSSWLIWIALNITLDHFWLAALLFAMGITLSALVFTVLSMSAYTAAFSSLSTNIVVWPVLLPWPFYSPMAPRVRARKVIITLLCLLNVVTNVVAFTIPPDRRSVFERLCFSLEDTADNDSWESIEDAVLDLCAWARGLAVTMAVIIIGAWSLQWGVGVWERWHRLYRKKDPLPYVVKLFRIDLDKPRRRWPWVVMCLGGIMLASSLVIFWMLRERVRMDAGDSLLDDEWNFGQIASVVTWVLIICEIVVVCIDRINAAKLGEASLDGSITEDGYYRSVYSY